MYHIPYHLAGVALFPPVRGASETVGAKEAKPRTHHLLLMTSTSPYHVSPSDPARAREVFLANGFVRLELYTSDPSSPHTEACPGDVMPSVVSAIWGEYMRNVCKAMVRPRPRHVAWRCARKLNLFTRVLVLLIFLSSARRTEFAIDGVLLLTHFMSSST